MTSILIKGTGIWLVIVLAAILNGTFREKVLSPFVGANPALLLSGLSLAFLVFVISFMLIPFIGIKEPSGFVFVGIYWVVLTLAFEFGFGYFVSGKSLLEVLQVFNITKGDLFVVVLCVTVVSPYFVAKLRGII